MGWTGIAGVFFLVVVLAGCGGVKGDYTCQGGLMDTLKLESGGKAEMSMTFLGQKVDNSGTYTEDGDKVNLVIDGRTAVFVHSGKTLDGGETNGKCTAK